MPLWLGLVPLWLGFVPMWMGFVPLCCDIGMVVWYDGWRWKMKVLSAAAGSSGMASEGRLTVLAEVGTEESEFRLEPDVRKRGCRRKMSSKGQIRGGYISDLAFPLLGSCSFVLVVSSEGSVASFHVSSQSFKARGGNLNNTFQLFVYINRRVVPVLKPSEGFPANQLTTLVVSWREM
nr:hypothetical protein Iba_chr14fCG6910 [Ipomoea batatas]